jgi:hypothetical protein
MADPPKGVRKGPDRLPEPAVWDYLSTEPAGVVCWTTDDERMHTAPARVIGTRRPLDDEHGWIELTLPLPVAVGRPACFVADSFDNYADIQGVIVQGLLGFEHRNTRITVSRAVGFAFAGRVPGGGP